MNFVSVSESGLVMETKLGKILDKINFSDWMVLSFFHSNLNTVNFQNFLEDLVFYKS